MHDFADLRVGHVHGPAYDQQDVGDAVVQQTGAQYALSDHAGGAEDDYTHVCSRGSCAEERRSGFRGARLRVPAMRVVSVSCREGEVHPVRGQGRVVLVGGEHGGGRAGMCPHHLGSSLTPVAFSREIGCVRQAAGLGGGTDVDVVRGHHHGSGRLVRRNGEVGWLSGSTVAAPPPTDSRRSRCSPTLRGCGVIVAPAATFVARRTANHHNPSASEPRIPVMPSTSGNADATVHTPAQCRGVRHWLAGGQLKTAWSPGRPPVRSGRTRGRDPTA